MVNKFLVVENGQQLSSSPSYVQVMGDFDFYVKMEIKRNANTTSSSIDFSCFSKADRRIAIAAKFHWMRDSPKGIFYLLKYRKNGYSA